MMITKLSQENLQSSQLDQIRVFLKPSKKYYENKKNHSICHAVNQINSCAQR